MKIIYSEGVFDYRALRLLVGLIAFSLPIVVSILSSDPLSSISASYYTEARDAFVGMLFIVSAFLWAYNGHSAREARTSKFAAIAAILVALFPTARNFEPTTLESTIHYGAAIVLFSILAYFCFVYFRKDIKGLPGKKGKRSKIYFFCGSVMVLCMLIIVTANFFLKEEEMVDFRVTYWAEGIALFAFGIAWIIAGKFFSVFVDDEEELRLFSE